MMYIKHAHAESKLHIVCFAASERWANDTGQFRRLLNTVCAHYDIPDRLTQLAFACWLNGRSFQYRTLSSQLEVLMSCLFIFMEAISLCDNTYLLTPWSRVLLEKLTGSAAGQEIPRIFGTRKFITVLTNARHLSLS